MIRLHFYDRLSYSHSDSNFNMNFNEIPPPPLLILNKQKTNNNGHDLQQSKLKNMVIDELKSFFANRNQNSHHIKSETNMQFQMPSSLQQHPYQQAKHQLNSDEIPPDKGNR
jgi:hypothetical protein